MRAHRAHGAAAGIWMLGFDPGPRGMEHGGGWRMHRARVRYRGVFIDLIIEIAPNR